MNCIASLMSYDGIFIRNKEEKQSETDPSSLGMSRAMKSSTCVFSEVLGNGQSEEERHPDYEEVPHRVHVRELQE